MLMSWTYVIFTAIAILSACISGRGTELAAAIPQGAHAGITLSISLAGSICLWTGVGRLMEAAGFTAVLTKLIQPILYRLFPSAKTDQKLSGSLSANIGANFLGLGNAATPMGIQAAQRLATGRGAASNELCRLIVLNTASIQLIPTTVAAIRSSLGCGSPFDILPAVWITSFCSAGFGLIAAWFFGKLWRQ